MATKKNQKVLTARRKFLIAPLLAATLLIAGCDTLLTGFRAGFAASKPAIQTLVPKVLTQAQADVVVKDVGEGIDDIAKGESCIKAITASGKVKQIAKARCYVQVAGDLRAILSRHHIGGNQLLDQIASLVNAAIAAFEEYNRVITGVGSMAASSAGADAGAKVADVDENLKKTLTDLDKKLKALSRK